MANRTPLGLVVIVASLLAACESSPVSTGEALALHNAEERWAARAVQSYSFETRTSCFCDPILLRWAQVDVVGNSITRVILLDSATEVPLPERSYFPTVARLFALIHEARRTDYINDVVMEFDPEFGYPTYINVITDESIADGGSAHWARNLTPAP